MASDIPHRATMARARAVACWMSSSPQELLFRGAAPEHHREAVFQVLLRKRMPLLLHQLLSRPERLPPGDDAHLVQRIGVLEKICHDGMARLVHRESALLLGADGKRALRPHDYLVAGSIEIIDRDRT